ncbi:MAG: hypothetical protein K0U93_12170 [Gammaproteobacteria bacterium]|nr:hypothetical protein [Gammaproteobacteria bacterium]
METRKKRLIAELLCDSIDTDDGVDPRYERTSRKKTPNHGSRQLERQAQRALSMALASSADPNLRTLDVVSVQVHGPRLVVRIAPCEDSLALPSVPSAVAALEGASGWLRLAVSESIARKRVPTLAFDLFGFPEGPKG